MASDVRVVCDAGVFAAIQQHCMTEPNRAVGGHLGGFWYPKSGTLHITTCAPAQRLNAARDGDDDQLRLGDPDLGALARTCDGARLVGWYRSTRSLRGGEYGSLGLCRTDAATQAALQEACPFSVLAVCSAAVTVSADSDDAVPVGASKYLMGFFRVAATSPAQSQQASAATRDPKRRKTPPPRGTSPSVPSTPPADRERDKVPPQFVFRPLMFGVNSQPTLSPAALPACTSSVPHVVAEAQRELAAAQRDAASPLDAIRALRRYESWITDISAGAVPEAIEACEQDLRLQADAKLAARAAAKTAVLEIWRKRGRPKNGLESLLTAAQKETDKALRQWADTADHTLHVICNTDKFVAPVPALSPAPLTPLPITPHPQ